MFQLSISSTILRFYLMMVVAIVTVLTGQWWLVLVVMAVAVSAILGYRIGPPKGKKGSKIIRLDESRSGQKRKAG